MNHDGLVEYMEINNILLLTRIDLLLRILILIKIDRIEASFFTFQYRK